MTDDEKAAALVDRVRADPFYRWEDPVDAALRRATGALRVKGMLVEALERLETDITNITGTAAREFLPHMDRVDVDARVLEALLAALTEARKPAGQCAGCGVLTSGEHDTGCPVAAGLV